MTIDMNALRNDLVQAVDDVLARYCERTTRKDGTAGLLVIQQDKPLLQHLKYPWPTETETFTEGMWYDVSWETGRARVLVAWSNRYAWGKERGRIIVFEQTGASFYPWAEFVEADDGSYVSNIPNPTKPKSTLKDGDELPAHLVGEKVRRTDVCFGSVKNGPSLRLVLNRSDEEAMITHAQWVASLRGRIS